MSITRKKKVTKKVYPVSINPNVIEDFDKLANASSRSRSSLAEIAFIEYIERHKNNS